MTTIEWTDKTWNPTKGCLKVSPGCANCYAMRFASRLQAAGNLMYAGTTRKVKGKLQWTGRVTTDRSILEQPLSWRRPSRIFVNSMSDLFHEAIEPSVIIRIWRTMERANWHQFQILTKRPRRMMRLLSAGNTSLPLPNVWLGVSVESRDYLSRLDYLRRTPAQIRFVSFEPLLAPLGEVNLSGIDWAIVGGESGPGARPMRQAWVAEIESQCRKTDTAFFFKQWGGVRKKKTGRTWKNRTWDDYPDAKPVRIAS